MATRVRPRVVWLVGFILGAHEAHTRQAPPPAYQIAAQTAGVPASILFALALQESGAMLHGRLIPWPWTLNIAGKPHRYATRVQACSALKHALRSKPATKIDAGLGQVSVGFHGHRVRQPCDLLDPYRNLAVTATILGEQHNPGEDWSVAIGRYHRPAGGIRAVRYERAVRRHLTRLLGTSMAAATLRDARP